MDYMASLSPGMAMAQMVLTDHLTIEKTVAQMAAQRKKSAWESWKLFSDLQTEIYKIQQEVTLHRARTQDKMLNKWDEYIKG